MFPGATLGTGVWQRGATRDAGRPGAVPHGVRWWRNGDDLGKVVGVRGDRLGDWVPVIASTGR